eukprot:1160142-Pelagomonas_calceolata.AAC.18
MQNQPPSLPWRLGRAALCRASGRPTARRSLGAATTAASLCGVPAQALGDDCACLSVDSTKRLCMYACPAGEATVTCLSVDLVGKVVAAGNVLGRTILYVLETSEMLCELRSNPYPVREVVFNQETTRLTTMCTSQAITWDLATGYKVRGLWCQDRNSGIAISRPSLGMRPQAAEISASTVLETRFAPGEILASLLVKEPFLDARSLSGWHSLFPLEMDMRAGCHSTIPTHVISEITSIAHAEDVIEVCGKTRLHCAHVEVPVCASLPTCMPVDVLLKSEDLQRS